MYKLFTRSILIVLGIILLNTGLFSGTAHAQADVNYHPLQIRDNFSDSLGNRIFLNPPIGIWHTDAQNIGGGCDKNFTSCDENWNHSESDFRPVWNETAKWQDISIDLTDVEIGYTWQIPRWSEDVGRGYRDYSNQAVAIIFLFDTVHDRGNNHEGWFIDDIKIGPLKKGCDNDSNPQYYENSADTEQERDAMLYRRGDFNHPESPRWQAISQRDPEDRGNWCWWYGNETTNSYQGRPDPSPGETCNDVRNSGVLMTPVVELGDNPKLTFRTRYSIGSLVPELQDLMMVLIGIDTDKDGLLDRWEHPDFGIDYDFDFWWNQDCQLYDNCYELKLKDADPLHKDIYVELDCLVSGDNRNCPKGGVINDVINAFAEIPALIKYSDGSTQNLNPDGRKGITLHVDPPSLFTPSSNNVNRQNFDTIKKDNFDWFKKGCYHYSLWGERKSNSNTVMGWGEVGSTNLAIGMGFLGKGNNSVKSLSGVNGGSRTEQATTFMHELGHNLGLCHGGPISPWYLEDNHKPHYLSVMNYYYNFFGVPPWTEVIDDTDPFSGQDIGDDDGKCEASEDCKGFLRYSYENHGILNEAYPKEEPYGGLKNPDTRFEVSRPCGTRTYQENNCQICTNSGLDCPCRIPVYIIKQIPIANPMDWDCSSNSSIVKPTDLNQNLKQKDKLEGHNDLTTIDLIFGDALPCHTCSDKSLNVPQALKLAGHPDADILAPTVSVTEGLTGPGGNPALEVIISDPNTGVYPSGLQYVDITGPNVMTIYESFVELPATMETTVLVESTNTAAPVFILFAFDWADNGNRIGFPEDVMPPYCALINVDISAEGKTFIEILAADDTMLYDVAYTLENAEFSEFTGNDFSRIYTFTKVDESRVTRVMLAMDDAAGNSTRCVYTDSSSPIDGDGDWVADAIDNCPAIFNPGQEDDSGNGIGEACEAVVIPVIVGLLKDEAVTTITDHDLAVGIISDVIHDTVPAGVVISQHPRAGATAPEGSSVSLAVSVGSVATTVPSVLLMTQEEAETAILAADLSLYNVMTALNDTVPSGLVIIQDPNAGTLVPEGSNVNIVISLGPPTTVPHVTGLSQAEAEADIIAADLFVGPVSTAYSFIVPSGYVINQTPQADSIVPQGYGVDLVVSLGPAMAIVPPVEGLIQTMAENAILDADLNVGSITTEISDTVPRGSVISQNPEAGESVAEGSGVNLVISLGPDVATVPPVVGLTQAEAESAILGAGLETGTITTQPSNTVPEDSVISQNPSSGTLVAQGNSINLVISLGDIPVTVPAVTGMTQADSEAAILAAGLTLGSVFEYATIAVPPGTVFYQSPVAGTSAAAGDSVSIYVAIESVNLRISKQGPSSAHQGQMIVYTLAFENIGSLDATNVEINDPLPAGCNFISAEQGGIYDNATRTVTWTINDLPAGASGEVSFTAMVLCSESLLRNMNYTISCSEVAGSRTGTVVDTVVEPVPTDPVEIQVTSFSNDDLPLKSGDLVTHTITLTNTVDETRPHIRMALNAGYAMDFHQVINDGGGGFDVLGPSDWTWSGPLGPNAEIQIVVTTQVADCIPNNYTHSRFNRGMPVIVRNGCNTPVGSYSDPALFPFQRAVEAVLQATSLGPRQDELSGLYNQMASQVARAGALVEMQITLFNRFDTEQSDVSIEFVFPDGLAPVGDPPFVAPTEPGASYDVNERRISWSGAIPDLETRIITFWVTFEPGNSTRINASLTGTTDTCIDINSELRILKVPEIEAGKEFLAGIDPYNGLWMFDPDTDTAFQPLLDLVVENIMGVDRTAQGDIYVAGLPAFKFNPYTLDFQIFGEDFFHAFGFEAPMYGLFDVAVDPTVTPNTLVYSGMGRLWRYDPVTREVELILHDDDLGDLTRVSIDPEGKIIAVSSDRGLIRVDDTGSLPLPAGSFEEIPAPVDLSFGNVLGDLSAQIPVQLDLNTEGNYMVLIRTDYIEGFGDPQSLPIQIYSLYTLGVIDRTTLSLSIIEDIVTATTTRFPGPTPALPDILDPTFEDMEVLNGAMAADPEDRMYFATSFPGSLNMIQQTPSVSGVELIAPSYENFNTADMTWLTYQEPPIPIEVDLAINKTYSSETVITGDEELTFTLIVTNNGPDTATNVTVTDTLPENINLISVNTGQGTCSASEGTVTCSLGDLATDENTTITIIVQTTEYLMLVNSAYVEGNETDPDNTNNIASTITIIMPVNFPPTADTGGPYTINEGSPLTLDGSGSTDPDDDPLTYAWNLDNDGDYDDATGVTSNYTWMDNGTYTIGLQVSDSVLTDTASAAVTVNNVAPTVEAGSDQTVDEGVELSFSGSFTDPGTEDTHTIEWNFGDSNTAFGTLTPSHVYATDGTYTVTLTVTDDDSGVGSDTLTVTVNDTGITAILTGDTPLNEGQTGTYNASGMSADPIVLYEWDWSYDGTFDPSGDTEGNQNHSWADNGGYTIAVRVTDDDGSTTIATLDVMVNNVAPTVDAGSDQTVDEGISLSFNGSFTDPGTEDTHTIEWNFGDGNTAFGTLTPSHTYTTAGTYTVSLMVTDDDGGVGSDTLFVTVESGQIPPVQTIFDLQARAKSGKVQPTWSLVDGAQCYNVYRSTISGESYNLIALCHETDYCTYLDLNVVNGTTYYYVVTSMVNGIESAYSNEASATPSTRRRR